MYATKALMSAHLRKRAIRRAKALKTGYQPRVIEYTYDLPSSPGYYYAKWNGGPPILLWVSITPSGDGLQAGGDGRYTVPIYNFAVNHLGKKFRKGKGWQWLPIPSPDVLLQLYSSVFQFHNFGTTKS